jgi:hypothetical protein
MRDSCARESLHPVLQHEGTRPGIGLTLIEEILDQHRFEFALEGQPRTNQITIQL